MKKIRELRNWTSIREGELIPRLNKRYGEVRNMYTDLVNPISQIVRALLGVKRLSEINDTNYKQAKEISVQLIEVVCKYDWKELSTMQKCWAKLDKHMC